jgi:hypothetical protein
MGSISTFGDSTSAARSTAPLHCLLEKITDPEKISKPRGFAMRALAARLWSPGCFEVICGDAWLSRRFGLMAWGLCVAWELFIAWCFLAAVWTSLLVGAIPTLRQTGPEAFRPNAGH